VAATLVPDSVDLARERVQHLAERTGFRLPRGWNKMSLSRLSGLIEELERKNRSRPAGQVALAVYSD